MVRLSYPGFCATKSLPGPTPDGENCAYDDLGFKTDALSRSIFFLRENIADFQKKRHDYILRGTTPERLQALRARYEQLLSDIDLRLKAGQLHAEVHRRAIDVRMTAFGVVFEALKNLFAVAAQQTRSAASILSDAAFYEYLVTHLEGETLLAAGRATGDVWLPLQLPVAPGQPFARGAVAEALGRQDYPARHNCLVCGTDGMVKHALAEAINRYGAIEQERLLRQVLTWDLAGLAGIT